MDRFVRDFELPVDIPQQSEIVKARIIIILLSSVFAIAIFLMFLLSVNIGFVLAKGAASLPDITLLTNWAPNQSTQIYDRHGQLVANFHGDEDRVVIPLKDISPYMQRAVMAIEDNRFYQHGGIDFRGTLRAIAANARGSEVQGGSTITQQLVKNLFLTPERSIGRKVAEALIAIRVEKHYEKNKILEMYLNQVYWGNQAYGIEKAARRYFKKPARDLTLSEAALLAGLLKAPEGLSPFSNPKGCRTRQLEVLKKMVEYGYITEPQRQYAIKMPVKFNSRQPKPPKYPYYVTYTIQELIHRFGEDVVRRGGLKVYTALDPAAQDAAEKALTTKVKGLPKGSMVTQGALIALDVKTAEIISMVGGVDFTKSQFNSATQSKRAAGSQFKPIVYLTGLRLGMITPDTPISDHPICFFTGYSNWCPKNWDGKYLGAMTIRRALALSRNTPTVQIGMKVGIDEVIKTAQLAGLTSPIDRNFSSLLGSSGFSPLEMATAFSTLARGGIRMYPTAIRRVIDIRGRTVPINALAPERTLDAGPIAQINNILIDVVEKGTGVNAKLPDRQVAGKTGTTDKVRDIWFTGYTPEIVATVWMGNDRYIPLNGVFSSDAAKVWHDFADGYFKTHPTVPSQFPEPDKVTSSDARHFVLNMTPSSAGASNAGPNLPPPSAGNPLQKQPGNAPVPLTAPVPGFPTTDSSPPLPTPSPNGNSSAPVPN